MSPARPPPPQRSDRLTGRSHPWLASVQDHRHESMGCCVRGRHLHPARRARRPVHPHHCQEQAREVLGRARERSPRTHRPPRPRPHQAHQACTKRVTPPRSATTPLWSRFFSSAARRCPVWVRFSQRHWCSSGLGVFSILNRIADVIRRSRERTCFVFRAWRELCPQSSSLLLLVLYYMFLLHVMCVGFGRIFEGECVGFGRIFEGECVGFGRGQLHRITVICG